MRWAITACVRAATRGVQSRGIPPVQSRGIPLMQRQGIPLVQSRSIPLGQSQSIPLAQYSTISDTQTDSQSQTQSQEEREAGRHRRRTKTPRFGSSKELIWRRQLAQLEQSWQTDLGDLGQVAAEDSQHFLVRELSSTLRRLGSTGVDSPDPVDSTDDSEAAVVELAWMQYGKIRRHAESLQLLRTIPDALIGLLICALNFARAPASGDGSTRSTRIVRVFDDLRAVNRTAGHPLVFAAYLRALNKLGCSSQVLKEVAAYERAQAQTGSYTAPSSIERQVIKAWFNVRRGDLALARLQQLPEDRVTPHVLAAVITGLTESGAGDRTVLAHVDRLLEQLGGHPAVACTGVMNEIMHAAGRNTRAALLLAIYERFSSRGTEGNTATVGILLHCAVRQEPDARQLRRVFLRLSDSQGALYGTLSAHVFGMFIDAFLRVGRADYAAEALDALRAHPEARVGARHLLGLLAFYAEHSVGMQALRVFQRAVQEGVAMPWTACVHVAVALARSEACEEEDSVVRLVRLAAAGSATQAAEVFVELLGQPTASAPLAFAGLMLAPRTTDAHHAALTHALHLAPGATSPDAWPTGLFDSVLATLAQHGDRTGVEHAYALMVQRGYDPGARTFNALLLAFARGNDVEAAEQVLGEMAAGTVRASVVSAVVHMFLRQRMLDRAVAAYAQVVGRTVPLCASARLVQEEKSGCVDFYALAMLVRALALASRVRDAELVFEDAFVLLPCVPRRLLETLVEALEDAGLMDDAQRCLRRFMRRVEQCQPPVDDAEAEERLPLSHFAYALGAERDSAVCDSVECDLAEREPVE